MKTPEWAFVKFDPIDYQAISYYSAPKARKRAEKPGRDRSASVEAIKSWAFRWMNRSALAVVAVDACF